MLLKFTANFQLSMSEDARTFGIKIYSINNKQQKQNNRAACDQVLQTFPIFFSQDFWSSHHSLTVEKQIKPWVRIVVGRAGLRNLAFVFWQLVILFLHHLQTDLPLLDTQEDQRESLRLLTRGLGDLEYGGEIGEAAPKAERGRTTWEK